MTDPFLIEPPALISFSGGRTSALMLRLILDAHGGTLPDGLFVTFANTGKEREETLRFVHECSSRWAVRVHWLQYTTRRLTTDDGKPLPFDERFEVVGFNSAARLGEPFEDLIRSKGYLPNAVTRFCTQDLKIRVMLHFMRAQGFERWTNVVGLRADEPRRVAKMKVAKVQHWTPALPLFEAGITVRDVAAFWRAQPFDLGLLPFEGNCDGCFLKARAKLWETERNHPGTLAWWSEQEKTTGGRFVTERTIDELINQVRRQPDLFAGGLFDQDPEMDAECGTWCEGGAP